MFFSVIVPIYNVEKYLNACVESVLNQTFSDFELILVDDGSPDNCPKICDEYKEKDSRVKVIHKDNGGLAAARQSGIKIAEGDYVLNLDSDDAIEPDTLQTAYDIIKSNPCDIISFSYKWVENSKVINITEDCLLEGYYNRNDMEAKLFPVLLMDKDMNHVSFYLAGKVIKRELLTPIQLNVNPKISLGEDLCCVFPCYLSAQNVYISKKRAYLYTKRTDSMSKEFNTNQVFLVENLMKEISSVKLEKPLDFFEQLSRYSAFMCFAILAAAAEGNHYKSAKILKKNILNSVHINEIKKAEFEKVSLKCKIGFFLMKRKLFGSTFLFLNITKRIRNLLKKG